MEIHAINIVYDVSLMAALMLVAKIIRAKVKFMQRFYIPTALIAGFLGLFLGKQFFGIIPFSDEISNYAGILIAVLFATMFLGNKSKVSFKEMINNVGDTFLVNASSEIFQFAIFILIGTLVLPVIFEGIHPAFGLMLPSGFVGGHGTAAAIGSVLSDAGWKEAISVGQTFATIGLLGGIILGVVLINIGTRKGYTEVIKSVKDLPEEILTGLVPKKDRSGFGENTVNAMSIDTLTWHLTLVMIAVGAAYLVNTGLKILIPSVSFPVYGLALLCSIALQSVLKVFKMDDYVDKKIVTHIGSGATDWLVAFGVASINVTVIVKYAVPIILLLVLGFIVVTTWFFVISPRFFRTYWFERALYIFGMSTGVIATGVILLRIADPEFKSGVLEDFGLAWIFLSIMDMLLVSFSPLFVMKDDGAIYGLILLIVAILCLILCKCMFSKDKTIT